jgi:hypothetical protein
VYDLRDGLSTEVEGLEGGVLQVVMTSALRRVARGGPALLAAAAMAAAPLSAQTLQGRVTDDADARPVAVAIVRLLDAEGEPVVLVLADSAGSYRLEAPEPGEYLLEAERLGYETTRSPLLAVADPAGAYAVDISMTRAPLGLEGITVTADRLEEIERGVRHEVGTHPRSLRVEPIPRSTIEEHLAKAHDVVDLVRWENVPSFVVVETADGPCFQLRGRSCVTVYVNGFPLNPALVRVVPLEGIETIVVLMPGESIVYPAGGVLLYTAGWLG